MAKTKLERIIDIENEIRQLENQRKQLLQQHKEQERKERTKRLCQRMGLFESMLPDTITLSDELFKSFLEKTVANDFGRRMLDSLTASKPTPAAMPSQRLQDNGVDKDTDEGESTRVLG